MAEKSAALENICSALEFIKKLGYYPTNRERGYSAYSLLSNLASLDGARERYYAHDAESLKIFDWISQYRIIMSGYDMDVPKDLPNAPFSRAEWKELEERAKAMTSGFVEGDYLLDRIDTWLLGSYTLKGLCEAKSGDVVLDCGAFTGSTSLYFSQKVGSEGHVYGFEPMAEIFAKYQRNMQGITNVSPVNAAVSSFNGVVPVHFNEAGSQMCGAEQSDERAYSVSIDRFVAEQKIERVNFIKMDIEGMEESALEGAIETIKRDRPAMALSAYHQELDIVNLPQTVARIDSNYKFALRHFSDCVFETVLYCYTEP